MEREIWKDVVGFEGYYQVSNMGRFKSVDRIIIRKDGFTAKVKGSILNGTTKSGKDGYVTVSLNKGDIRITRKLHRLIAIAFMPLKNYGDMEVNHIDYNRTNNKLDNLEWTTHAENVKHSSENGRYKGATSGIKNGRSQYTEEEIRNIRKLYDKGYTVMDIIKIIFPDLDYRQRKNKWSRMKEICSRDTYKEII